MSYRDDLRLVSEILGHVKFFADYHATEQLGVAPPEVEEIQKWQEGLHRADEALERVLVELERKDER